MIFLKILNKHLKMKKVIYFKEKNRFFFEKKFETNGPNVLTVHYNNIICGLINSIIEIICASLIISLAI